MHEIIEEIIFITPKSRYETMALLVQYYTKQGHNIMQASAKAESNLRFFCEDVQNLINYSTKENVACLYNSISNSVANINLNYFIVKEIHSELKKLSWQVFEDFCAALMKKCFGASSVDITQRTADMGLDFKGFIPFKGRLSTSPFTYIELYGQAKKYLGNVGRGDVDAFTAFANRQKRDNTYPAQLFVFCTTSDFIPSAKAEIIKNHFVSINGFQIATLVFQETGKAGIEAIREFL
ncbi:restriction endonuclease [Chitinophaga defluvii]|uniref:Restriction endonuclease n=1 Tax=Chitinophaga defluvii TaxID=3163343 RepID=A0ABV2T8T6_9BACT